MEFLRKHRFILIAVSVFMIQGNSNAQNNQTITDAFKESYRLESKMEYSKAFDVLNKVYDEKSYEMNLRQGWLLYQAGLFEKSVAYYKKAMDLKPYAVEPVLGFALPASMLGKWKEIEDAYDRCLNIDPNNSLINFRKGLLLYNRGDFQNAEKYFEKVVNLYPFDYDGLHMLAWTKLRLGKTGDAKVLFQKALYNRPDDKSATEGLNLIK